MTNSSYFKTLVLLTFIWVGAIGCGDDNGAQVAVGPHCDVTRNNNCNPHQPHIQGYGTVYKRWSGHLTISDSSAYRQLAKDHFLCDQYMWNIGTARCKSWDNRGFITIELNSATLPSEGRVIFSVFLDQSNYYREFAIPGTFLSWNSDQGFAMWTSPGRVFKAQIDNGRIEDDLVRVNFFYGDDKIGQALARVE